MIRLFCGWDRREAAGLSVFVNSVVSRASEPVSIIPIHGKQGNGSNTFTYSRFNIPSLCDYEGWAIFADGSDMVCTADIAELWKLRDEKYAVQVVKNTYKTNSKVKYIGTNMECPNIDYERKNWSSVMLLNCGHKANKFKAQNSLVSHQFNWLKDVQIGELPAEWNWLCDEYGENKKAKILHWTQGIPGFEHYRKAPMSKAWMAEKDDTFRGLQLGEKHFHFYELSF